VPARGQPVPVHNARERRKEQYLDDGSEIFGPGRTWWEVYEYVRRFTVRKWPGAREQDVEDAVSEAVERTMTMWVHWKGSVVPDDPGLTMRGAKRHAAMWAHKALKREMKRRHTEVPVAPSDRLTDAASDVIAALQEDEREWVGWAKDWLEDGLGVRETARKQGVSHVAIHKRRKRGMERIEPLLREHGLWKGAAA